MSHPRGSETGLGAGVVVARNLGRELIETSPHGWRGWLERRTATSDLDVGDDPEEDDFDEPPDDSVEGAIMPAGRWILRDVNFEIGAGEAVLIRGVKASGKSTLLHIVAGLLPPTEGTVLIAGRTLAIVDPIVRVQPAEMSVRRFIETITRLFGNRQVLDQARWEAVTAFCGVSLRGSALAKRLSSTDLRKLSIASILHLDGEVLLVDTTLGAAGPEFAALCREEIEARLNRGATVMLAARPDAAPAVAHTRTIELDNGTIAAGKS